MFNKVIMIGNLTRDVELRYLNTGTALATIGLASNHKYKKQDGNYTEEVCFIDITLFGRYAEVANQYLKKGSKILVEGRLKFDSWTDQNGLKRSKHTIVGDGFELLDSRQSSDHHTYQQNQGYAMQQNQQDYAAQSYTATTRYNQSSGNSNPIQQLSSINKPSQKEQHSYQEPPAIDIDEDDLPF